MKIVSFKICPFVQRVTALMETKGVNYEVEYIDLSNKPQWFLDISPNAQVPILITDNDHVLFESDAIVEYLDEVIGEPLSASNPIEKAKQRAWSYLASKHYLVQCSAQCSSDAQTLQEHAVKLKTAAAKINTQLGEQPFLGGKAMGMVDIAWLTLLHRAEIITRFSGYDLFEGLPRVQQWQAAVMNTGIPQASVSEDFEDRFKSFYLSESTYLGRKAMEKSAISCAGKSDSTVANLSCCT